jgi:hypothetical protein
MAVAYAQPIQATAPVQQPGTAVAAITAGGPCPEATVEKGAKDLPWIALFSANAAVIAYYAVAHGLRSLNAPDVLSNSTDLTNSTGANGTDTASNPFTSQEKPAMFGTICYMVSARSMLVL